MRKFICILAGVMLLGNASSTVSFADVTGQMAQLIGPGGQQNESMQPGGKPGDGLAGVQPVPGQDGDDSGSQSGTGAGPEQSVNDSGSQPGTGAGPGQSISDSGSQPGNGSGQGQPGSGSGSQPGMNQGPGQNSVNSGYSQTGAQTVTGPGGNPAASDTGDSQTPTGPGYGAAQGQQGYGPGFPSEEKGDGTVLAAPQLPQNNFLNSVVTDPVVNAAEKYSYDQMVADIRKLQARYGEKIHVNVIGHSHDGRELYEVIVGNVNAPKHILLQGAIHAREYMTPLIMMSQIEMALFHYNTGQYDGMMLRDMFQQTALHFVPMSNPDGVSLSQFGLAGIRSDFLKQTILNSYARDTAEGRTALPLEQYLTLWKSNAAGVDLNHNFPADWEGIVTSAVSNSYAGYKGGGPLSEPESLALASMADKYAWVATISYHSMGNIIYWDTQISRVKEASLSLAQSISAVTGYRTDGSDGKGGFKDWMQSKDNPVPGITIEVGSVSCPLPLSQFDGAWQQNKAVWAQAMKWSIGQ